MQQPAVSETTEVVRPVENIIKPTLDLQPALEFIEKNASNPAPGTRIKKVNGNWVITTTDTAPTRQHAIQTTLAGDASRIYTLWKDLADTQKQRPPVNTQFRQHLQAMLPVFTLSGKTLQTPKNRPN